MLLIARTDISIASAARAQLLSLRKGSLLQISKCASKYAIGRSQALVTKRGLVPLSSYIHQRDADTCLNQLQYRKYSQFEAQLSRQFHTWQKNSCIHIEETDKTILHPSKRNLQQKRNQHTDGNRGDKSGQNDGSRIAMDESFLSVQTRNQITAIWTQAQSIPNIITITRICSTPVLCHLILTNEYKYAMGGCILAGISDWLDGHVARTYDQKTVLGTYLDPFADKIFINAIALSLGYVDIIPGWCASLWLGRDMLLIGMSYRAAAIAAEGKGHNVADPSKTPLEIKASTISKINTCFQFGTISSGLGFAAIGGDIGAFATTILSTMDITPLEAMCYVTSGTTVISGLGYLDGNAMAKLRK